MKIKYEVSEDKELLSIEGDKAGLEALIYLLQGALMTHESGKFFDTEDGYSITAYWCEED